MRILLVRRGAIGDLLMTTPLIRQLRVNYPTAELDFCLAKSCSSALKNNPNLSQLILLDDKVFSARKPWLLLKYILSIRNHYDHVFILGKNWLVNLLFRLSGACLIGFARESISRIILDKYVIYNDVTHYQVLYNLDLLDVSRLGSVDYNDIQLDLAVTQNDEQVVSELLDSAAITKFVVVTNSGGNNQFDQRNGSRMLPENKILALLEQLLAKQVVILLGGAVDYDNYESYCRKLGNPPNLHNYSGKLSIAQSSYLLTVAKHFYVTDCGAMHFGIVAGISARMTCFFGPTDPRHILPPNTLCRVIWQDQDIFNSAYQIYGKLTAGNFFARLNINEII